MNIKEKVKNRIMNKKGFTLIRTLLRKNLVFFNIRTLLRKNLVKVQQGFTLIELLVVVALIGILATLVLANLNAARERGRDAERKADLRNIETALRLYYNDKGIFPQQNASSEILGCGALGTSACTWGEIWQAGSAIYMPILPSDPIDTQVYRYTRNDLDSYTLQACLENKSDLDGETTADTSWCSSAWMYGVEQ